LNVISQIIADPSDSNGPSRSPRVPRKGSPAASNMILRPACIALVCRRLKKAWQGGPAIDDDGDVQVAGMDNPQALAEAVVDRLRLGTLVALTVESPLSVPVPFDWHDLGRARTGEGRRPWSAGAGTGALATGLVQAAWICRHICINGRCTPNAAQTSRLIAGTA
jgi:hypothetical protein